MELRQQYETNGYVVCRNLVPPELIDNLVKLYKEQIVTSKQPFLRQMTNQFEPNDLTEFGYVKQDFLDVHNYNDFPEFNTGVKDILCSDAIQNALKQITGSQSFKLMQSLIFDLSRETVPHQDSYYLDTVPSGHVTAVWVALEDIDERAGRFYVMPKTADVDLHSDTPNLPHWEWLGRMGKYFGANQDKVVAPALKKGDALFWDGRLVHGALQIQDPTFSRKSMTAHYIPTEYNHVSVFVTKDFKELETYKGVQLFSATVPTPTEWSVKQMAGGDYIPAGVRL